MTKWENNTTGKSLLTFNLCRWFVHSLLIYWQTKLVSVLEIYWEVFLLRKLSRQSSYYLPGNVLGIIKEYFLYLGKTICKYFWKCHNVFYSTYSHCLWRVFLNCILCYIFHLICINLSLCSCRGTSFVHKYHLKSHFFYFVLHRKWIFSCFVI